MSKPNQFIAITPSDGALLKNFQRLVIGGAGNLVLKSANGTDADVTLPVAAGQVVPFASGYVRAATTATGIVGMN
ncbi:hypothetical protein FIM10_01760 [Sphingomonadales bacterium 56]|uniref:spike base protein, RCAP_Rcc01079 family n=1 Tax=unclassified Sphingobium TaxID=2611147 RepID=UPI0019198DDB|nr:MULTISPECIES: hypothetical protein [unclassified Sphingobium]MBY2927409.1 hypothetical protein [Sphingomonadales bacterium 56]MBY2957477.1 hypothetical protein [Sphingomonadales bacterium 58]MBY2957520.1 hypothetical protein [Sphingomonadales bacterium 58]CAD7335133.1 hypothetical protein SPHS8_00354 [Sphingobium sp. S8]CAD7335152.1 hypothetical protein SPHS6_00354 [Sphingobium sp. S6]